jgi:hypothetical protein
MKRKIVLFLGIVFLLCGIITFLLYGMHGGQAVLLIVGVLLLLSFKSKTAPQKEASSGAVDKPQQSISPDPAADRDTKSISLPVAGVTFSNESGKLKSRQAILRRILFNDPPFDCDHVVTLEKYLYEGDLAYYVKVNDCIIGNVPKEFIPHVDANIDRPYKIVDFQVYGGQNGKKFGASLKIVFLDVEQN